MTSDIFFFIAVGFCAQIVDGALGMAFGVLSTTSLLAFGVPAANASAMTHVTEMFTTAASGLSHAYHRNVDWRLVARLAPAGMIGGAIGAYLLANIDGKVIEPFVSGYLIVIGLLILYKLPAAGQARGARLGRAARRLLRRPARCDRRRRMGCCRHQHAGRPRP